jgi:hypothetical protein
LPEPCPIAASNANCTLVDEATQQISDTCTLRNSCSFNVTNEFFGSDPCIDTEKRAVVQYSCTAAPATPQLNTALVSFRLLFAFRLARFALYLDYTCNDLHTFTFTF